MRGFTLIEVLISVIIFFIVSISAINIFSNTNYLLKLFNENKKFYYFATIEAAYQKEVKTLYEAVLEFNLRDDKLIHILKIPINFEKRLDSTEFNSTFNLYKLKIYNSNHSLILYKVE